MITEKIYETDGERLKFDAVVVQSFEHKDGYALILDRTAFFPGGGGQEADEGYINGERIVRVCEENGEILHIVGNDIRPGTSVSGEVDGKVRLPRMQGHSGEHIVSGIICRKYGYNNVGFHMGENDITIDFDGVLDREQLDGIEDEANDVIYSDRKINISFPDKDALACLDYRSKKELSGRVRIVEIEGIDRCACCAPHFSSCAKIGIVKILDFIHYKGGVRLHLLCGRRALEDYRNKYRVGLDISMLLSLPQPSIFDGVKKLNDDFGALRYSLGNVWRKYLTLLCETEKPDGRGFLITFVDQADTKELRFFANTAQSKYSCTAGIFSGNDEDGYQYIICSEKINLSPVAKLMNSELNGRGGGAPVMIQGTVKAGRESITAFFDRLEV